MQLQMKLDAQKRLSEKYSVQLQNRPQPRADEGSEVRGHRYFTLAAAAIHFCPLEHPKSKPPDAIFATSNLPQLATLKNV